MPVLAVAFHQDIAPERLHAYFADPEATMRSGECSKCGLVFGIVLTQKFDPRNNESLLALCQLIAKDCHAGTHEDQYVLNGTADL
jgi:hypothetical protein